MQETPEQADQKIGGLQAQELHLLREIIENRQRREDLDRAYEVLNNQLRECRGVIAGVRLQRAATAPKPAETKET